MKAIVSLLLISVSLMSALNFTMEDKEPVTKKLKPLYYDTKETWQLIKNQIESDQPKKASEILNNIGEEDDSHLSFEQRMENSIAAAFHHLETVIPPKFKTLDLAVKKTCQPQSNNHWFNFVKLCIEKKVPTKCFQEKSIFSTAIINRSIPLIKYFIDQNIFLAGAELDEYKSEELYAHLSCIELKQIYKLISSRITVLKNQEKTATDTREKCKLTTRYLNLENSLEILDKKFFFEHEQELEEELKK